MELSFDASLLNRMFPFYIVIDEDLKVNSVGHSLEKVNPGSSGISFFQFYRIARPLVDDELFNFFKENPRQLVIIECINNEQIKLRGQIEFLDDKKQLVFFVSPWFNSMEQLVESKLSINDFAFHDPMIDLLHVFKNQEITNTELKQLYDTVNEQKEDLKKAAQGYADMALFPTQNPDPLIRIDSQGNIVILNPVAQTLTQFDFEGKSYSAEAFWKVLANRLNPTLEREVVEAVSMNKNYSFVVKAIKEKGYYNIYGRDVSQLKKDENQIKLLAMVASANENGVIFINENGTIYWSNKGTETITGYTNEEIIGKTPLKLLRGPLSDNKFVHKMMDDFSNKKSFNYELIQYCKDGSWYWGKTMGQPIRFEDGKVHYFMIIEDISLHKQKEQELMVLSSIAEKSSYGVVISNNEGIVEWVNKSFEKISGYSAFELLNTKPGKFLQGKDTDPEAINYLSHQIKAGEPFTVELINYHKSGRPYWVRIQGQALKDEKGNIVKYFALEEDITEKKETEEKIREFESKFRIALEKIGDNVWEHDFRSGNTYFSKKYNEFLGIDITAENDNDKLWWQSIHQDDLPILIENDKKCRNREIDSFSLEYRIIDINGKIRWVLDRGVVTEKNELGDPVKITGTHTNITRIKETEIELNNRLSQIKSLSENIPGIIYEYEFRSDGSEGFRYVSSASERILGLTVDQFYEINKYFSPDDLARIWEINNHCKETLEPIYLELPIFLPGSEERWLSISASFSYHSTNGSIVYTGFFLDITDRKKFEKSLRANEEKYRNILANMNLGLMEIDTGHLITFANKRFCEMVGLTEEEILGVNVEGFLSSESIAKLNSKARPEGLADAYELEVNINGHKGWWFVSTTPKFNESNEYIGSIIISLDINERKEMEQELILARERAEQLGKTKEIFLANMSHEIRTPMNAIIGMSNQLAKSALDNEQRLYLKTIQSASDNLLIIINDILDFSKIEAGKLDLEYIGFELNEIISQCIQVMIYKAQEKGISLTNSMYDSRISKVIKGDPYRINQILLNLLSNAIKFTDKGEVDVTCELLEEKANIQKLRITVRDSGIGMDEVFVNQIFDKFTQEYKSGSRKYGGTGLGMSISKDLIELMGGSIKVKSEKGVGTTISLIVEFEKGSQADLPQKEVIQITNDFLAGKKILVTDDNVHNRLVASIILQNYGAATLEAGDGQEALDLLNQEKIDLVLMDIQMPVLNGLEATAKIRESDSKIPVIALTANAIKGENEKCIAVGMNDYIAKPFKEEEFVSIIAKWISTGSRVEPLIKEEKSIIMDEKLYDLETLNSFSRGNEAFLVKMIKIFCDQVPGELEQMMVAYKNNDLKTMGTISHKIKPNIDNFNINTLKEDIRWIERQGNENVNHPDLEKTIYKIRETVERVIAQMKKDFPQV